MKILLRHWRKLQNFHAPIEIFVRHGAAMAQKKTLGRGHFYFPGPGPRGLVGPGSGAGGVGPGPGPGLKCNFF